MISPSQRSQTTASYDSANKNITLSDPNGSYMAVGLSNYTSSWGANDIAYPLYEYFLGAGRGNLDNKNGDTPSAGSVFELVANLPDLTANQSATITMIIGIGSTAQEAKNIVLGNKGVDIESLSDNYWNQKLSKTFSNLPQFTSGDASLNKIYKNAILSYLVNRWSQPSALGEAAGFGQSISLFPWFTGTTSILPLIDTSFWKTQLNKLLTLNLDSCRAYDNVSGIHLCDNRYSYSKYTLLKAVYDYIASTSDFSYLTSFLYSKLEVYVASDDAKEGSDGLVDFGTDRYLYEYNIHCSLGGNYTGKVISPNAERVVAHLMLAEMAEKLGLSGSQHRTKADQIKADIQSLWNTSANWFDSINLYDPNGGKLSSPQRKTFRTIIPYLLLEYDGLLTPAQVSALKNQLPNYIDSFGFTSLPKGSTWCSRTDWHGPGLYSGAVGSVLTGLFKNNEANSAYSMMTNNYSYLAEIPYFSQAFPSGVRKTSLLQAYLEGVSMAQAIIKGIFGVEPNFNHTKIRPNIPSSLLSKGKLSLTGLRMQGHIWDVVINSLNNHSLIVRINAASTNRPVNSFRFGYKINGTLDLNLINLSANTYYLITAQAIVGGNSITKTAASDSHGLLKTQLSLNGDYFIKVSVHTPTSSRLTLTPSPTKTSLPTSGLSNTPTSVSTGIQLPRAKPGDANCDGLVDGFDYVIWRQNFST